jgi:mannosyltransferase OCH1-like enzyme
MDHVRRAPSECVPRVLHLIWLGGEPPAYFFENKREWERLMPHWEVRAWHDCSGLDERVAARVCVAESGAQKADLMRYAIMYEHGGVYVDADITPHRSLDSIVALGARVVLCHDLQLTWGYIINAFFAAAPREPLFALAVERSLVAQLNTDDVHMQTGPRLLGMCVERTRGDYVLLPPRAFYRNVEGDVLEDGTRLAQSYDLRYGNHFYASTWRM